MKVIRIGGLNNSRQRRVIYSVNGLCPTLMAGMGEGGGIVPMIIRRFKIMVKIGDKIQIVYMDGEPQYTGAIGIVTSIDSMGQLHGTWGGLAIVPDVDSYTIIND